MHSGKPTSSKNKKNNTQLDSNSSSDDSLELSKKCKRVHKNLGSYKNLDSRPIKGIKLSLSNNDFYISNANNEEEILNKNNSSSDKIFSSTNSVTNLGSNQSGSSKKHKRVHKNLANNEEEILNENNSSSNEISCTNGGKKVTNLGSNQSGSSKKKHRESSKYPINLDNLKSSKHKDLEEPSKNSKNKEFSRNEKKAKNQTQLKNRRNQKV
ncbi:12338_t:CDS:2 [Dentiscutata erythropus]|uniref:12338_t:CDS:1 n=1 Tax=Dentiscutata erythropus TaxID=1348616 RepID=A0A9N9IQP5_9GLOM|nr:12338_t:CDS:2 [Dentiscutata erythropus]